MAEAKFTIKADDRTRAAFASVRKNMGDLGGRLLNLKSALAGAVGVGGFGALIKSSIDAGDRIQKLAISIGASTEALSQYRHVTNLTGVEFETFATSLGQMQKNIADANDGTGAAVDAFRELGISVEQLQRLSPEQQFETLADAFARVDNAALRTNTAMAIFGEAGVGMMQVMDGGSEAIRAMRAEADRLGLTLTREQADRMAAANDAITTLSASFTGLGNTIALEVAEPLTEFMDDMEIALPASINAARFTLNTLQLSYFGVAEAIQSVITWRAKMDEDLLKKVPGAEGFFEKHLGYDPGAKEAAIEALTQIERKIINLQNEQRNLMDEPFRRVFDAGRSSGMTVGGDQAAEISAANEKIRQAFEQGMFEEIVTLEQSFKTKVEIELAALERRQLMVEEAHVREIISAERKHELLQNLEQAHQDQVSAIRRAARDNDLALTSDLFGSLAQLAQQGGEKSFKVWKDLARAQTFVSTYSAAQKAFESQLIPGDPTSLPRAVAASAAAVIGGLARVAAINQTSLGSQSAGNVPTGGPGVGSGNVPLAVPTLGTRRGDDRPVQINNIHVHGDIDDLSKLARSLRPYNIELGRDTL